MRYFPAISLEDLISVFSEAGIGAIDFNNNLEVFRSGAYGKEDFIKLRRLAESKGISVKTPEVVIKVSPGCADHVETRVIDGTKYILIRADTDVEVNGINIQI